MLLSRIEIKNFRKIEYADIHLSNASFIIGPNNVGKTTVIKAIDALLSSGNKITADDFRVLSSGERANQIEICGYFTNINTETSNSKGFKGRVVDGQYIYKKTYDITQIKPRIWTKQYDYHLKDDFIGITKWQELIDKGYELEMLTNILNKSRPANDKLPTGWEFCIEEVIDWDLNSDPKDVENPGGIPTVVISKLPRLVHIPSYANVDDIGKADGNKTLLGECLGILFEDLLSETALTDSIRTQLSELEQLMSPDTENSMVDNLSKEVNAVINDVFPGCGIKIIPSLQDLHDVLKPKYAVEMFSNINTSAEKQGTGLVRTAIFSMLRYHSYLQTKGDSSARPLFIAFEEPEIYLHPSAANLLRDTIYALGETDQIICSTHSPWMIDLTKDWQSLTKLNLNEEGYTNAVNYGVSEATQVLQDDEKELLKMIKTFDDELSRIFFTDCCVVVEGDSEVIAIKNTINLLPFELRKEILSKNQVVKARGKAAIIPLVKYLKSLSIPFYVIHDRDQGTEGAIKFNQPIEDAVGDINRISKLEECLENCLGYNPPNSDKPYRTYLETSKWNSWHDVPQTWKDVFSKAFDINCN